MKLCRVQQLVNHRQVSLCRTKVTDNKQKPDRTKLSKASITVTVEISNNDNNDDDDQIIEGYLDVSVFNPRVFMLMFSAFSGSFGRDDRSR